MTTIVAARSDTGIIIAADSLITAGWTRKLSNPSKLWTAEPYAIGAAGCLRTLQVIHHWAEWPKYRPDEDIDLEAFAVKQLVPTIFKATEGAGVAVKDHEQVWLEAAIVIAWGDNLVEIDGDGSVVIPVAGRCAVGSGAPEAVGYLGDVGPWTVQQVVEAARRATMTDLGSAGPIDYVTTPSLDLVRGAA